MQQEEKSEGLVDIEGATTVTAFLYCVGALLIAFIAIRWIASLSKRASATLTTTVPKMTVDIQTTPDRPCGFGRKNSWFAVRSDDPQKVAEILGLQSIGPCNWHSGFNTAYAYPSDYVFVTPVLNGWVLAVGTVVPQPEPRDKAHPQWHQLMSSLSERWGEAMFFATHRGSSYAAWARFQNGKLRRLFVSGDDGVLQEGEPFPEELQLLKNLENIDALQEELSQALSRGERPAEYDNPDEEFVLKLAESWSVNPVTFDDLPLEPSCGLVGRLICKR